MICWDTVYSDTRKRGILKRINEKIDYDTYIEWQKDRAISKWGININTNMRRIKEFSEIWDLVKDNFNNDIKVICLGIKNGFDYLEFKKLFTNVYGVDICNEVKQVGDNCYCCDFNFLPKEWGGKFDLVYSNSIDHAFNIKQTIKEWRRITKKGGYLMIMFSKVDFSSTDIYSFEINDVKKLFINDDVKIIKELENEFCALVRKK